MVADDFFARWSRKKSETVAAEESVAGIRSTPSTADVLPSAQDATVREPAPLPTSDDVEKLTHDSDYSVFMTQGVDETVRRSAMKKLFTDPHFNVMDGLDVYIEDFSKFEPITPAMLASLNHVKNLLNPESQFEAPFMRLMEEQEKALEEQKEEPVAETDHPIADEAAGATTVEAKNNEAPPQVNTGATGERVVTPDVKDD